LGGINLPPRSSRLAAPALEFSACAAYLRPGSTNVGGAVDEPLRGNVADSINHSKGRMGEMRRRPLANAEWRDPIVSPRMMSV
jgi:hypothetical protein